MDNAARMAAYRARLFEQRQSEADRAHRAKARTESDAVRQRMLADPRYHTPD